MSKIIENSNGTKVATLKINKDSSCNFYISQYNHIPVGKVVYDYFHSGELFVNFPQSMGVLTSLTETLQTIYVNYALKDTFFKDPNSTANPAWTKRYVDESLNGWIFDIDLIFNYEPANVFTPVCKHYTGFTKNGSSVISSGYLFANKPDSVVSNCSNEKIVVSKTSLHNCPYSTKDAFSACPFYEYSYEVVKSFEVNSNSSNSQIFELRYVKSNNDYAVYQLFDLKNNQINYTAYEKDTEEFKNNVLEVIEEIVSSYTSVSFDVNQRPGNLLSEKTKQSYILSLV